MVDNDLFFQNDPKWIVESKLLFFWFLKKLVLPISWKEHCRTAQKLDDCIIFILFMVDSNQNSNNTISKVVDWSKILHLQRVEVLAIIQFKSDR